MSVGIRDRYRDCARGVRRGGCGNGGAAEHLYRTRRSSTEVHARAGGKICSGNGDYGTTGRSSVFGDTPPTTGLVPATEPPALNATICMTQGTLLKSGAQA